MDGQDDRAAYKEILGLLEMKGRLSVQDVRARTSCNDEDIRRVLDRIVEEGLAQQVPDSDPQQWARGSLGSLKVSSEEPR